VTGTGSLGVGTGALGLVGAKDHCVHSGSVSRAGLHCRQCATGTLRAGSVSLETVYYSVVLVPSRRRPGPDNLDPGRREGG
jgi:hypothetical protein